MTDGENMPKIRNNRNICLYCFGDLDERRVCKACKKKADDEPNLPHQLGKRSMLQKRYLIDKAIGEGGFGITYAAWDVVRGIKVAIKEYYPSGYVSRDPRSNRIIINAKQNYAASNRGLKRFIDEAKNLSSINNLAGIVSVYDFFSANNTAYIVMEYLDGISLKKYVRRKGKLDIDATLAILKPVILSLGEVHATGLIHRDISPDNILITKNNEVKLIDFGASKAANIGGQSVSIVLKQGFAPEEQYRLHGEQGPWTDIYALGVTIYYCITGQLPPESIQRMYDDTIIPPSQLNVKIDSFREKALMKALAVFAKDRYRTIKDFAADIYKGEENEDFSDLKTVLSKSNYVRPSEEKTSNTQTADDLTAVQTFDGTSEDKTKSTDYAEEQETFTSEEFSNRSQEKTDDAIGHGFNVTDKRDDLKNAYSDETAKPRRENAFESVNAKAFRSPDKTETNAEKTKTVDAENIGENLNAVKITKRTSAAFIRRDTSLKHRITPDALKKKFFQQDFGNEVSKSQTDSAQEKENKVIESAESSLKENEKKENPAFPPRTSRTERTHKESALRLKKMFEVCE